MADPEIHYLGIFLSKRDRAKLFAQVPPKFNQKSGDHFTLVYAPTDEQVARFSKQIGKKVVLTLTHEVMNERIQVVVPKRGTVTTQRGQPHITISWKEGASPVEANQLVAQHSPQFKDANQIQPWLKVQGVYDTYPRTLSEAQGQQRVDVADQVVLAANRATTRMETTHVSQEDTVADTFADMLQMARGGTVSGRKPIHISEADLDYATGDVAKENATKKALLDEMRRRDSGSVDRFIPLSSDLMESMTKEQVDGVMKKLRSKIIKRGKSGRGGTMKNMERHAAECLAALEPQNMEVGVQESNTSPGPMPSNTYTTPTKTRDDKTSKETQDLRKGDDDSQDAGEPTKAKAGNDRGASDPIGEALAAFRANQAGISEANTAVGKVKGQKTYTAPVGKRPAGESGNTDRLQAPDKAKLTSNAPKPAKAGHDRGAEDPIGEDASGGAKGRYRTQSRIARWSGGASPRETASATRAQGKKPVPASFTRKGRTAAFKAGSRPMEADADFDNDGDVDEKDKKFTKNINNPEFKARIGDPKDKVKDEGISEAQGNYIKAMKSLSAAAKFDALWGDGGETKSADMRDDKTAMATSTGDAKAK